MKLYMLFLNAFLLLGRWIVLMSTILPFLFQRKIGSLKPALKTKKANPFNHQLLTIFDDHKKDLCKRIF